MEFISRASYYVFLVLLCLATEKANGASIREDAATATDVLERCNGSISECQPEGETLMESDTARRFLAEGKHISFGALSRDQPACSGGPRGQAYSNNANCIPPQANPYHRGCSKYYRCKRDD